MNAQYAESHFGDIVAAASRGEEVEIDLGEKPALLLVSKSTLKMGAQVSRRKNLLGAWEGLVSVPTDEEWRKMNQEIEHEMLSGSLLPVISK